MRADNKNTNEQGLLINVIIVNYKKARRVAECINSLCDQSIAAKIRITIVDNSIDPDEADFLARALHENCNLIVSDTNIGYTKAVNLAAKSSPQADYLLLISPDIIVEGTSVLEEMVSSMEANPCLGALTTAQYNDDGSTVEVARKFPTLIGQIRRRLNPQQHNELYLLQGDKEVPKCVDWVQSSFLLVSWQAWNELCGLDEAYFLFMADVDFGRRIRDCGLSIAISLKHRVRADGIRASRGRLSAVIRSRVLRIHIRDAVLYYATAKVRQIRRLFVGAK